MGTRVDILNQIEDWIIDSDKQIFWLSGVAGAGKSTISRTVAASSASKGILAGSFFFSRGHGSLGQAGQFVTTLVRQLVSLQPWLRPYIANKIMDNEELLLGSLEEQWNGLVIVVFREAAKSVLPTRSSKLVFVVDGLDECDRQEDVRLMLRLFRGVRDIPNIKVQVFLTSRREIPLRLGFSKMPDVVHHDLDLGSVPRQIIEHDISAFLETELGRIAEERQLVDWPAPLAIKKLLNKSELLFIYAATVCRFIGDPTDLPSERLSIILENNSKSALSLSELDTMYTTVLEHSIEKDIPGVVLQRLVQRFQQVIGSFINLFDVLSPQSLASLLDLPLEHIDVAFQPFHSLVYIPSDTRDPLRAIHPSFREFLLDDHRCLNSHFQVNPQQTHLRLFQQCLATMSSSLDQDICKLRDPSVLIDEIDTEIIEYHIPEHVQYACLYWVAHLSKNLETLGRRISASIEQALDQFLKETVLNWVEAMSLLRKMSDCIYMLAELEYLVQVRVISSCRRNQVAGPRLHLSCQTYSKILSRFRSLFPSSICMVIGYTT